MRAGASAHSAVGFSLAELLVVIVITAILTSIAVANAHWAITWVKEILGVS